MEELYTNLDDYEEVNAIEELRNENKNLKLKVDEYAIAMEKLQKDFDILSSEFKRLEINYSSLLKTARAEVERKTQIITNLNMEKDMLVLNSIQNGNKSLLSIRRNMTMNKKTTNKTKNSTKKNDSDSNKSNKNSSRELMESSAKLKDFSSERLEENIRPSDDIARNSITDIKLVNKLTENVESCSDRNSYAKEINIHHKDGYEGSVSAQSGSIKHRRKSMLALSAQDEKFSTDEEWDTDFISKEPNSKDYSSRKEYSSKKIERDINEKQNRKHSDPSNIDDKYYGSNESSRENRKSRNFRNHDGDKYRSQDKYSRKSWRHTSPDRSQRKSSGDGHNQRSGYRNRVLESPPHDKYSKYKRKTREHHMNFERNQPPIEYSTKRHYNSEKQMSKYKSNDYEEPSNKRVRTNSFHRHVYEDDNKRARTNSYHKKADEEDEWYDNINSIDNDAFSEKLQDLRFCQSPDLLNSELQQESNCKEIKHTASTQLEDPRMTSKKYVVKSDDDKLTMCTVVGRNVDIEPIDKDKWNISRAHVPELFIHKPLEVQRTEMNENLVKEIYMDIDIENPVANLSLEAGEIYFEPERVTNSPTKELDHKEAENGSRCAEVRKNTQELNQKAEDPPRVFTDGYKIPKIKHYVKDTGDRDSSCPLKPKLFEISKDHHEKIYSKDFKKNPEILEYQDNFLTKDINDTKQDVNHQDRQENYTISSRQIVEGDLELSDEASDSIDLHQFTRKDKHLFSDPKHCKNDYTVKDINIENIASLPKEKDLKLVHKNLEAIPKKHHHSSIFDIQHFDENEEKTYTKKSRETVIVDEIQKSYNDNELSMIDIQPSEMEVKEKVNKNKKFADKNEITLEKDCSKEEADTKGKEIIFDKNQKPYRSKLHTTKLDVQHHVDDKNISLEIKNAPNNQETSHMNEPEYTLIDIQKHVEEIKERANTNKNKEKFGDKIRKSNDNKEDTISKIDTQRNDEEIKDETGKNNGMKLYNTNCNQKQDYQSMIDIQITEEDTNVKTKPLITLQQQDNEIHDKCDKNKEIHISDKNEAIEQSQKQQSKKNNKMVKDIDDKSNKKTKEIKEADINRKISKNIKPTIEEKDKSSEPLKTKTKKSQKLKETHKKESSGDTESLPVTVKKRSKKEKDKPKEIKNKFTDLFGDSCSLITPEELGINSAPVETIVQSSNNSLPIFEDAQDAIDLKEIAQVQLPSPIVTLDVKSSSSTKQNSIACTIDVDSQKHDEVKRVSGEIAKVCDMNVNLESSPKEADTVKTVIISTRIQPSSLENIKEPEIRHEIVNIEANTQTNYNAMLKSREFSLKALATSTPHKDVQDKVLESESKAPCIDSLHTSEQSDTNTLDSQTDVDVPDVRIFVRRRRKVIKKSMT